MLDQHSWELSQHRSNKLSGSFAGTSDRDIPEIETIPTGFEFESFESEVTGTNKLFVCESELFVPEVARVS
jgi:hypothetical protein